jgi:hypothetical protein
LEVSSKAQLAVDVVRFGPEAPRVLRASRTLDTPAATADHPPWVGLFARYGSSKEEI